MPSNMSSHLKEAMLKDIASDKEKKVIFVTEWKYVVDDTARALYAHYFDMFWEYNV